MTGGLLGLLGLNLEDAELPLDRAIWKLTAFVARYAHQPVEALHRMPITSLMHLADHTAELLRDESEEVRRTTDG